MINNIYIDYNATSPLRPEARDAIQEALEYSGNASSLHSVGRRARSLLETARQQLAQLVDMPAASLIFTSGGTESAHLALCRWIDLKDSRPVTHLFLCATEHPSVLYGHDFTPPAVTHIPVHDNGQVNLRVLEESLVLQREEKILVALQAANNETGVLQPMSQVAELVHHYSGLLACDAVQLIGKMPVSFSTLQVDLLFFSAHKFGGPPGVGCLVHNPQQLHLPRALLRGGGQERRLRAGTENLLSIIGAGASAKALHQNLSQEISHMMNLRDSWEKKLRILSQ